jgi:hypothetical protein
MDALAAVCPVHRFEIRRCHANDRGRLYRKSLHAMKKIAGKCGHFARSMSKGARNAHVDAGAVPRCSRVRAARMLAFALSHRFVLWQIRRTHLRESVNAKFDEAS